MADNINERVSVLETRVTYLENGHNEMKLILRTLQEMPYEIKGVNTKLDTLIETQRELKLEVKDEITQIEERLDCVEEKGPVMPAELPKFLGLERNQIFDLMKWGLTILFFALVIIGNVLGIDLSPFIGFAGAGGS